ncbi:hypothetical protein H681_03950 [Pseudomonas sp. ATCC 13867]|uniref:DUF6708 domain-containing protein n=1 Tax=Pseudomonas sp. ATCC 13867 TaxID=1294143 RepID=UPI0002C4DF31|nr:DUF6708 domain-containing protein [Pseudomonas sp. ATCC 13867]AGI22672.1 hypothetical protein H681_03950 [Pseudomonas sp. ATCC 13867]
MSFSQLLQQARLKFGPNPMEILAANQPTGETPMELFLVEQHSPEYLAISTGGESDRGLLTGVMGGGSLMVCGGLSLAMILGGKWYALSLLLALGLPMFLIPFAWETLRPLSLPIIFNRRTREVYFEQGDVLYHTPWDDIRAIAGEFMIVGPQMGGMRCASLEVLMHRFEHPQEQILVSLGLPMGKTLSLQKSLWEYIRAYMNNGPWFDKDGQHSESDAYVKSLLSVRIKRTDWHKYTLEKIRKDKSENQGKNYLGGLDAAMLIGNLFFYPINWVHEFTNRVAKRRPRKGWPEVVRERLRPDGPTTRLIDLEHQTPD